MVGVATVAFARHFTFIVNSRLRNPSRSRVARAPGFGNCMILHASCDWHAYCYEEYILGRRFSSPNDRSPDENVKRSAHDGQFPQERYLAIQGLALAVQPAAGSLDRGRSRAREAG